MRIRTAKDQLSRQRGCRPPQMVVGLNVVRRLTLPSLIVLLSFAVLDGDMHCAHADGEFVQVVSPSPYYISPAPLPRQRVLTANFNNDAFLDVAATYPSPAGPQIWVVAISLG